MRFVALLPVLMLMLSSARAPAEAPDPVLAAIAGRLERPAVVRGRFVQTRSIAGLARPLVARGRFVVVRGEGVLWDTEEPFPQQLRIGPRGAYLEGAGGGTSLVGSAPGPAMRELNRVLGALFEADFSVLSGYFRAQGDLSGTGWHVSLQPRAGTLERVFSSIALQGDALVREIELREANGDSTHIGFEDVGTDAAPTRAERDALAR
jgi:hypothetical protein